MGLGLGIFGKLSLSYIAFGKFFTLSSMSSNPTLKFGQGERVLAKAAPHLDHIFAIIYLNRTTYRYE
jgi:hypothetical protein